MNKCHVRVVLRVVLRVVYVLYLRFYIIFLLEKSHDENANQKGSQFFPKNGKT